MEVEYTKGKWERKGNIISVFGKGTIAKMPNTLDGGVMEFIVNSHLISAAPDLYEALKEILNDQNITRLDYLKVHKALSKAEGM